jgi:hypothetical protein
MASPLQIILNDRDYQEARDAGGGGPRKDFYEDRDREFHDHKATLLGQLGSIESALRAQAASQGDIGYIKVILSRDAWAKSHRPLNALFKSGRAPLVGGGDLGEMYFEARPRTLREIARDISAAEDQARHRFDSRRDKTVANPSALRSETGAVSKIELYGPRDRRSFSVDEAIAWLTQPMTGSAYHIELFDLPPPHSQLDAYEENRQKLYSSFVQGLSQVRGGLVVQRLPARGKATALISARLEQSSQPPRLLLDTALPTERVRTVAVVPFDRSVERHRRLLGFLDHHPLVKHIDLPPAVVRTIDGERVSAQAAAGNGRTRPTALSVPTRNSSRTYPRMGIIDGGISAELGEWVVEKWDLLNDADVDLAHGSFIGGLAVAGNALNGNAICAEPDGAELVDVAVYPSDRSVNAFDSYFPQGVPQFFEEIEYAITDAKARHGVRVFNMSLNIQQPAEPNRYSSFAAQLDQIAEANDVSCSCPAATRHRTTCAPNGRPTKPRLW